MIMISIHSFQELEPLRRELRLDRQILRRLRNAFFKEQATAEEALQAVPESCRDRLRQELRFHFLTGKGAYHSRLDGASKLVFGTPDGLLIESVVLRIRSGRTALCISTQAGCAARCGFCATGLMGLKRNLTADEILDQVIQAGRQVKAEGLAIRNVVLMGMGEPFHNETEVHTALSVLRSPQSFNFSGRHLTVSTIGIPGAMVRFAEKFLDVHLALSLHSARQKVRETLMPLARLYPLPALRAALETVTAIQGQPIMIEYLMLRNLTDTPADLGAMKEFLTGIPVHINLIPWNPVPGISGFTGSSLEQRQAFAKALKQAGFKVTLRYSLGADIAAGCGQLAKELETDKMR